MVSVKNCQFFDLFISGRKARQMYFMIFLKEKRLSGLSKQQVQKVENLGFFHGFGQKLAIFPPFYFRQDRPGMCVSRYYKKKKRLSKV